jgi:alpha-D-ribose 1-methylphosphonate 5-triphosphate synthase subunit PhnL
MKVLQVENYTKQFVIHQLDREIEILANLNFALDTGAFLLITGANGVGKSTLLRCLYRTYLATNGHAYYHSLHGVIDLAHAADVDIAVLRREEIGFVTQFLRPRPRVTAVELVAEPLLALNHPFDQALQQASELLEAFGLKPELWKAYPTTFSGGEQQKVNLARALIAPRRLLLLDEPTASLDAPTRAVLVERLAEKKKLGVAMIGVFHHPEDIRSLVDQELLIEKSTELYELNESEQAYVVE